VDFNKKTFNKALERLLWTQLRVEPKYQIQQKLSNYESGIMECILYLLSYLILPQTCEIAMIISILQVGKLKLREVE
jgi:hypothetical protein